MLNSKNILLNFLLSDGTNTVSLKADFFARRMTVLGMTEISVGNDKGLPVFKDRKVG